MQAKEKLRNVLRGTPENNRFFDADLRALAEKCDFTVREYQVSSRYNGSMELILTKSG